MTASNLVVPLVLWGQKPPTHCISTLLMTHDQSHVVTGCHDGHICVWSVQEDWKLTPRTLLLGHTATVNCLAHGNSDSDKPYVVSASDNGEMSVWNLADGRCLEHTKMSHIHTDIQGHQMLQQSDVWLVCIGYYPDIHIIHPLTLQIMFSLASRMTPDWISAFCVLRPVNKEDDVVVAISNSGVVKVWSMAGASSKTTEARYEDEAKQIRCLNAQMLRCCPYNQRTVLIICSKYWQIYATNWTNEEEAIYDAGDFSLLCSESSRCGERWVGGDFIAIDKVVVWSSEGRAYLYKLPTNYKEAEQQVLVTESSDPGSEGYRKPANPRSPVQQGPQAYHMLDCYAEKSLECTPCMQYVLGTRGRQSKLLLRGDSAGRLVLWMLPDVNDKKMRLVRQESFEKLPVASPKTCSGMGDLWSKMEPEGIIDQLNVREDRQLLVTACIYMPGQGRLVCGRDDGSIVIVAAIDALVLQLLDNGKDKHSLQHQVLRGHTGRVNCLLSPYTEDVRYDPNHLLSGGADFTVVLWDLSSGDKLHTYCVHGGEVTQLLVPPPNCNARVLPCVASVASDHSLALLSLKERKCLMLAARQLFPIHIVKWRPLDDFLVIGCTDGTVFVWQMETGHLDRVVHGTTAEEILNACDERMEVTTNISHLTNPTISITQAIKRANLATFRNFAQQQLQKAQDVFQEQEKGLRPMHHPSLVSLSAQSPLTVQGLRTNIRDPDSHLVFLDIEALIVQLLNEEFAQMSPSKLEALGFYINVPVTQPNLTDTQRKVSDFITKVKDKAENVGQQLTAKLESEGLKPASPNTQRRMDAQARQRPARPPPPSLGQLQPMEELEKEPSLAMKTAQLLLSCLHAWGQDGDLDTLCRRKLGLLTPRKPLVFGLMSRTGHMALSLPGWYKQYCPDEPDVQGSTQAHWRVSRPLSTHHLLSVIAASNTLMSMTHATFLPQKLQPRSPVGAPVDDEPDAFAQAQTKQGWSLLATLHCVLLPDLIGRPHFQAPLLELLARRWQDRCLEIREAAQALLLAELRRIGAEGRKRVVEEWAPYLPSYADPALAAAAQQNVKESVEDLELDEYEQLASVGRQTSQRFENRRRQATAIVMLGVLGAEFGAEMQPSRRKAGDDTDKKSVMEGFGISKSSYSMHTSKALTFLLLHPATARLPQHTPIRRAAVDLLGRGFTVWEPYLDVSAVLLGLLELCVGGDQLVPSMTFGLPLCPPADACRTARHALSLIATARPPAFIITMAKEVARYNAIAQNAQTQHVAAALQNSPLLRAKPEILRIIELLVDKIPSDVADLLVEVMDITVHCVEHGAVRARGLQEIFPAICKFNMVSYCGSTRRIAVGAKTGAVAFYELKQAKCQLIQAHSGPVTAVSFSADGKHLCSYSFHDQRLLFWQTASSSLFGLGSQTTRVTKTYSAPRVRLQPHTNPLKLAKLVWVDAKNVVLLAADGTESRFRL